MPLMVWFLTVGFVRRIRMGMMQPTLQQILAGFDNPRWLLTPGKICSGSKVSGALALALFIASWWPCPERHSAMVVNVVLRWTHGLGSWHSDPVCVTSTLELLLTLLLGWSSWIY